MTITIDPESFKQLCLLAIGTLAFATLLAFVVIKKFTDWLTKSDRWLKPLKTARKTTAAPAGNQSYSSDGFDDPSIPF